MVNYSKKEHSSLEEGLDDLLKCADSNYSKKNYNESLQYFKKALNLDSTNQKTILGLINSYIQIKDYR